MTHDEPIKPGYKRTEVGVIPEDWKVVSIHEIADVKTGPFGSALHERDYVEDGTPIITVEHLGERGVLHSNLPMVSDDDKKRLRVYELEENDIVFSRVGAIDRNSLIRASEAGWLFSGRLLRVRPDRRVFAPYLSYHFHTEAFKERVRSVAVGQTMASLNTQILNGIDVILPPLTEQIAIAEVLSDVDALLEALDRLIAKKRDIKLGAMQALLTGRVRLPGFSGNWEVRHLGEVADIKTGERNNEDKVEGGEYPFFVRSQTVERIDTYSFDGEAILVPGEGGIGSIFHYISGKFDYHQRVYKISNFSGNVTGKFIYYTMVYGFHSQATRHSVKATVDSLRLPTFQRYEFASPSASEQRAIAEVLSDMDAEIETLEKRRAKLRSIKQGMMQELLTGRTRLVQPQKQAQEVNT